jgi:hypothetical protein
VGRNTLTRNTELMELVTQELLCIPRDVNVVEVLSSANSVTVF